MLVASVIQSVLCGDVKNRFRCLISLSLNAIFASRLWFSFPALHMIILSLVSGLLVSASFVHFLFQSQAC
jgi:hypothetical protein